jgi:group I intron endonuclease
MHYIIYKTTNKLSGKYYIGCHQTDNLNDGYIGSGKYLKHAIKKYGIENFKFEILHIVLTKQDMFQLERELVNDALVKDPQSYNLKIGGSGGNPGIVGAFTGKTHSAATKEKIRQAAFNQITTDQKRIKLSQNNWAKTNPDLFKKHAIAANLGKPKTDDHKKKLATAQQGSRLVNNGNIAKWAKKEEVEEFIINGWKLGKIKSG